MGDFEDLKTTSTLAGDDLLALYDQVNDDARKIPLSLFLEWFEDGTIFTAERYLSTMQYETTVATGFSITATDDGEDVWITVTAGGAYAAGTLVLPADPSDQQEIWFYFSATVTSLTINGNGKTVYYTPHQATGGYVYKLKYDSTSSTWYHY